MLKIILSLSIIVSLGFSSCILNINDQKLKIKDCSNLKISLSKTDENNNIIATENIDLDETFEELNENIMEYQEQIRKHILKTTKEQLEENMDLTFKE